MGPLSDMGLPGDDKVKVEHILVLSVASTLEEPLRRALVMWGDSSRGAMQSLKVLGYAAATYLVLAGASLLVDSFRKIHGNQDDKKES